MKTNPVVVIGGGISGLSAAYYLQTIGKSFLKDKSLILIEASKRFGGWMESLRHEDGVIYETGPRSFRIAGSEGMNTLMLADSLGLSNEVIGVSAKSTAAKKRLIYVNNQLHVLPNSLMDLFKKKQPFSERLIKSIISDVSQPKLTLNEDDDISVHDFVERRFGTEIAKFVIDPLCRGITAGDSRKLSMKSMFPEMFNAERNHGSVVKGMILSSKNKNSIDIRSAIANPLVRKSIAEKWAIWGLRMGSQSLPEKLTSYLLNENDESSVKIHNNSEVQNIHFNENGTSKLEINTPNGLVNIEASHVFSAIPAHSLAKCIKQEKYAKLRESLKLITSVHTVVVNLEYSGKNMIKDPAFGFLTPSTENVPILGIIYDSCSFPELDANNDVTRITCMMGGAQFDEIFGSLDNLDRDKCLFAAFKAVDQCLGIKQYPSRFNVSINKNCIPQYNVGHERILNEIENEIKLNNLQLSLLGASFRGICRQKSISELNTSERSMQRGFSGPIPHEEFIKLRYLSGESSKKKRVQKSSTKTRNIRIHDEDLDLKKLDANELGSDDEMYYGTKEEKPVIAAVIDERPLHLKRKENKSRWVTVADPDCVESPIRNNRESDLSPPRKQLDVKKVKSENMEQDLSPPRHKTPKIEDLSPPRRRSESKRKDYRDSRESPHRKVSPRRKYEENIPDKSHKSSDSHDLNKKHGLCDAKTIREEVNRAKLREKEMMSVKDAEKLGKGAKTVYRDSSGKIRDLEKERLEAEKKAKIDDEKTAKYKDWNMGLKQKEDKETKAADALYEMTKPLARYEDDADLDKLLREKEQDEDPMLQYMRKKKAKERIEEANQKGEKVYEKPRYKGPTAAPLNRYGIEPGYRWDGVDRSNGFERDLFARIAEKTAIQEEAYRWSTEDM
ncbi:protoporphyrinogen oxidase-like protein [Leptotrombidium deliense]|uniref:BUD13 homolog n=1 Tax=Leptotrombidium deliense TaxID=299467 RepID=A0A443SC06_9ACAR|nr:protoporphyrinogen oxidase-like protein [Leptotrombidium deliense]